MSNQQHGNGSRATGSRSEAVFEAMRRYLERWRQLNRSARLYLVHAALLTASLALYGLFFNLAIEELGYSREFLGTLNGLGIAVAAGLSVPLWWMVARIGLRPSLIISATLQAISAALVAAFPSEELLLLAAAFTGMAATIFQVSSPPFMMEQSTAATRDHVFSANAAINVGLAGVATFFAGELKLSLAGVLGVGAESVTAYRATFGLAAGGLALSILPLLLIRTDMRPRTRPSTDSRDTNREADASSRPAHDTRHTSAWIKRLPGLAWLLTRLPDPLPALILSPRAVLALLVSPLLISFGAALLIQYLNLFFKDQFAISDVVLGRIFATVGVITGLAALAGPMLSTRIGKIQTIVLTQLLSIPFLLLMGFAPLLGIAVAAAIARGALFNMAAPLYDAFALERTDEAARPIVIGLINGAYTVGYLVAPFVSTRVQVAYGFAPLFIATAIFYGLAAAANYLLFLRPTLQHRNSRTTANAHHLGHELKDAEHMRR